jgi:hypothetical protein
VWRRCQPSLWSQAQYSHLQTLYQSHQSCPQGGWALAGVELPDYITAVVTAATTNNVAISFVVVRLIVMSFIAHSPLDLLESLAYRVCFRTH